MSDLAVSPVVKQATLLIPAPSPAGLSAEYPFYTVDTTATERIEAVYMTVINPVIEATQERYILRIKSSAGLTMFVQSTAQQKAGSSGQGIYALTWARGGQDTDRLLMSNETINDDADRGAWWTGPLPDFVLDKNCTLTLQWYNNIDETGNSITVQDIAVTVARNPNTPEEQTITSDVPLWLPLPIEGDDA